MFRYLAAALIVAATPALAAQEAMPMPARDCPATPVPPPAELAGWQGRTALSAASDPAGADAARIVPGKGVDAALLPTPAIRYPVRPAHPGGSVSHGGIFAFEITEAGTYRVAIGSGAWIEVVRGGQPATSTAHQPGPACSGVRKMVDFTLEPGSYLLEIAGNGAPRLPILIARLPR
ncbi:homogentisate 1,2-dioxygenase [Sphingomonas sp. CL5.1]|uniref:homogentisate 1,2-dioxygenase n=1 Tax=Sphingomonas sp. CL5.1 TaxID=2653203 RepID=UPI0020C5CFD4|nr:homogentisate 1,2-dioxygenase [Sphingomonas sp. CL5.1]